MNDFFNWFNRNVGNQPAEQNIDWKQKLKNFGSKTMNPLFTSQQFGSKAEKIAYTIASGVIGIFTLGLAHAGYFAAKSLVGSRVKAGGSGQSDAKVTSIGSPLLNKAQVQEPPHMEEEAQLEEEELIDGEQKKEAMIAEKKPEEEARIEQEVKIEEETKNVKVPQILNTRQLEIEKTVFFNNRNDFPMVPFNPVFMIGEYGYHFLQNEKVLGKQLPEKIYFDHENKTAYLGYGETELIQIAKQNDTIGRLITNLPGTDRNIFDDTALPSIPCPPPKEWKKESDGVITRVSISLQDKIDELLGESKAIFSFSRLCKKESRSRNSTRNEQSFAG